MKTFYHNFDLGIFVLERDLGDGTAYFRRIDLDEEYRYLTNDSFPRYAWSQMFNSLTGQRCIHVSQLRYGRQII